MIIAQKFSIKKVTTYFTDLIILTTENTEITEIIIIKLYKIIKNQSDS
jgi:hypothetical protein